MAYVVSQQLNAQPEALLLATGSEVGLAVEAQKALEKEGIRVSVVSLPSWDRFDEQSDEYKESVLPKAVRARLQLKWVLHLAGNVTLALKAM